MGGFVVVLFFGGHLIFDCFKLFAFIITNIRMKKLRRGIQTISYMPNFVAPVVVCNLLITFCASDGAITQLLTLFGVEEQNLLANATPPVFWLIYAMSGVWMSFGYGSIMYVASLSNISGDLYEAAALDRAGRWQCIWHVSLPQILPLIIMMFTIQVGVTFRAGFDRILLLPYESVLDVSDTLFTYTYRMAFGKVPNYGLSAASNLFQSVVGTVMLFGSNKISSKLGNSSLF